jgi:hypothetical protein
MYSLTIFKSIYDNKTNKRMDFSSWNKFEDFLYKLSEQPLKNKKSAVLISPATYEPDTTRKNKNVIEWARWAAVDVDDHEFKGDLEKELRSRFGNWYFVCYSTASSTEDRPKFRLVFPLKDAVPNENIKKFWYALQTELGEIGDKQTKDLSRMYYIPGSYANAHNFIFTNEGSFIDPDVLIQKHPMEERAKGKTFFERLPEEMQQMIIQHRKDQMENTTVSWQSYRDCPFLSKGMLDSYIETTHVADTGRYHKMYQLMVHIAGNAVSSKYPITPYEIADLCRQIDIDTGNRYEDRPLDVEASRAIEFVYKNVSI